MRWKLIPFKELPKSAQNAIHASPFFEKADLDRVRFGFKEVTLSDLVDEVWKNFDAANDDLSGQFDSFADYHEWYKGVCKEGEYGWPPKWAVNDPHSIYAIILEGPLGGPYDSDEPSVILDGWHRFHWYLDQYGPNKKIPVVWAQDWITEDLIGEVSQRIVAIEDKYPMNSKAQREYFEKHPPTKKMIEWALDAAFHVTADDSELILVQVKQLDPAVDEYIDNARFEKVLSAMKDDPTSLPPVLVSEIDIANKTFYRIIDGHHRYRAAQEAGVYWLWALKADWRFVQEILVEYDWIIEGFEGWAL